jgi:hypothetical protein
MPLTKMVGHVGKRHGIHLIGDCVIVLVAQGSKVDVQISQKYGVAALWACPPYFIDVR